MKKLLKNWILANAFNEEGVTHFVNCYENEFNHYYNKKQHPNEAVRIAEYLKGLPSCIDLPFEYAEIRKLILSLDSEVSERTLHRYTHYFFEIVGGIIYSEIILKNGNNDRQ